MSATAPAHRPDERGFADDRPGVVVRAVALIDARMGSTEAPGTALVPILGRPLLWYVVQRLRAATRLADVVVLTTDSARDTPIRSYCHRQGIAVFAGRERDATDRVYRAAIRYRANPVVLVDAAAAFVDPTLVDSLVDLYEDGGFDYAKIATGLGSTFLEGGRFPEGMEAEVLGLFALERSWAEVMQPADRQAVTAHVARADGRFRVGTLRPERSVAQLSLTIACSGELELARRIYAGLGGAERAFTLAEVLEFLDRRPELLGLTREYVNADVFHPVAA